MSDSSTETGFRLKICDSRFVQRRHLQSIPLLPPQISWFWQASHVWRTAAFFFFLCVFWTCTCAVELTMHFNSDRKSRPSVCLTNLLTVSCESCWTCKKQKHVDMFMKWLISCGGRGHRNRSDDGSFSPTGSGAAGPVSLHARCVSNYSCLK